MSEIGFKSHYLFEFLDTIKSKNDYYKRKRKSENFLNNLNNLGPLHLFDESDKLPGESFIDDEVEQNETIVKVEGSIFNYSSIVNPELFDVEGFYDNEGYLCYSNNNKNNKD